MAHVLATLADVNYEDVKQQLEKDASGHAAQGMYLEYLWRDADDPNRILFLFRVNDLNHCRQLMNKVHAQARRENPDAKLPQLGFLDET